MCYKTMNHQSLSHHISIKRTALHSLRYNTPFIIQASFPQQDYFCCPEGDPAPSDSRSILLIVVFCCAVLQQLCASASLYWSADRKGKNGLLTNVRPCFIISHKISPGMKYTTLGKKGGGGRDGVTFASRILISAVAQLRTLDVQRPIHENHMIQDQCAMSSYKNMQT